MRCLSNCVLTFSSLLFKQLDDASNVLGIDAASISSVLIHECNYVAQFSRRDTDTYILSVLSYKLNDTRNLTNVNINLSSHMLLCVHEPCRQVECRFDLSSSLLRDFPGGVGPHHLHDERRSCISEFLSDQEGATPLIDKNAQVVSTNF